MLTPLRSLPALGAVYTGPDGSLLPWTALGTNALWEVFGRKAPVGALPMLGLLWGEVASRGALLTPPPGAAADAHIHLKLHRSELLPEGEEELKKWCMLRWKEKQARRRERRGRAPGAAGRLAPGSARCTLTRLRAGASGDLRRSC